jgi:hypothetical protein
MQEKTLEPALEKVVDELEHARRELAPAERRAEAEIGKAEELIEELERKSNIKVNGRNREIEGDVATFEQVVKFAFPSGPSKPNTRFTVTYRNAAQVPAMGELDPHQSVKVKTGREPEEETIFNVTETVLS